MGTGPQVQLLLVCPGNNVKKTYCNDESGKTPHPTDQLRQVMGWNWPKTT